MHLSPKDVCYLLCEINVIATHFNPPLEIITFATHGHTFEVSDEEWMYFVEFFASQIVQDGWSSACCDPPSELLKERIRNQHL